MDNKIVVEPRNVYGENVLDPVNVQAQYLADLAGTKTLTPRTLKTARLMGFTIELGSTVTLDDNFQIV
jgi:hypothetical protein